jgi:hypothetical protein
MSWTLRLPTSDRGKTGNTINGHQVVGNNIHLLSNLHNHRVQPANQRNLNISLGITPVPYAKPFEGSSVAVEKFT